MMREAWQPNCRSHVAKHNTARAALDKSRKNLHRVAAYEDECHAEGENRAR